MIGVIADDITGAAEIAGVCLAYGLRVSFTIESVELSEVDVMVIATDTRSLSLKKAVNEMARLSWELKQADVQNIFKKTDSVLRGHVLEELKASLEIFGKSRALLVPANPEKGRIIASGNYYINEIPLNNTSFAKDPDFPMRFSGVEDILGHSVLALHTGKIKKIEAGVTIPDTGSKEELEKHVQWSGPDVLLAGSAAFFGAYLKKEYPTHEFSPCKEKLALSGKMLIVCGSTHEESRAFIREARERLLSVSEMPRILLQKDVDPAHVRKWVDEITDLLKHTNKVVVAVSQSTVSFEGSAKIIKETLASAIKNVMDRESIHELLIEGGATAFAIVREIGCRYLTPVLELNKGVVRMRTSGAREFFITIKPGSYQWPEGIL